MDQDKAKSKAGGKPSNQVASEAGHAVGVVPIDDHGHTWLVRQSRYTLDSFTWEIPEGGALNLHTSNSVTDERAVIYVATNLSVGEQALDETEDIEVSRIPLKDAIQMVLDGEITDAMSVAALLRLRVDGVA